MYDIAQPIDMWQDENFQLKCFHLQAKTPQLVLVPPEQVINYTIGQSQYRIAQTIFLFFLFIFLWQFFFFIMLDKNPMWKQSENNSRNLWIFLRIISSLERNLPDKLKKDIVQLGIIGLNI